MVRASGKKPGEYSRAADDARDQRLHPPVPEPRTARRDRASAAVDQRCQLSRFDPVHSGRNRSILSQLRVELNFSSRHWSTDAEVALKRAERAHEFHTGRREIYFANTLLIAIERAW
jgi:hypothetical protein